MKTRIYSDNRSENKTRVIINFYDDFEEEEKNLIVFVPAYGGYVREYLPPNYYVKEAFSNKGDNLRFDKKVEGDNFLKFIRNEWKKFQKNLVKSTF